LRNDINILTKNVRNRKFNIANDFERRCTDVLCRVPHAPWKTLNILEKKVLPEEP
jgi:hypothetical protein